MIFDNETELKRQLLISLEKAVAYVIEKINEENQKDIEKMVYGVYTPNTYERTWQFYSAWREEVSKTISGSTVTGHYTYDPSKLNSLSPDELDTHMGIHHGVDGYGVFQEYLAQTIFEGLAGHIYGTGAWTEKRDAWGALEKWLGKNKLRQLFEEGMTKAGLQFQRHITTGIEKRSF